MRKVPVIDMSKCTDCESCLELCRLPARLVINPLFSFLYSQDQEIKWAAVWGIWQSKHLKRSKAGMTIPDYEVGCLCFGPCLRVRAKITSQFWREPLEAWIF